MGAIYCFAFDFLNLTEEFFKASKIVFYISDVLFFVIVGFLNFCFFLAFTNGEVRGFVFFGEIYLAFGVLS